MAEDNFEPSKCLVENDAPATADDSKSVEGPSSGIVGSSMFGGNSGPGYWIEEDQQSPLEITFPEPRLGAGKVIRLSPAALWFVPREGDRFQQKELRFSLKRCHLTIGPLRAKVTHLDAISRRPCVGLQLLGVPIEKGRQMVALLNELVQKGGARIAHNPSPVLEEITCPDRICAILTALITVGSGGSLASENRRARASITRVDMDARRIHWKTDEQLFDEEDAPSWLGASIVGYNSVYRFCLPDVQQTDDGITAALPERLVRVRHRYFRRIAVRTPLRVRFEHPLWEEIEPAWREVLDISLGGICFATKPEEDLLFPALNLPYIEIETQYGAVIHLRGQVRNAVPSHGDEPASCGASVVPISPEDEIWWMRLVSGMLYNHVTQTS